MQITILRANLKAIFFFFFFFFFGNAHKAPERCVLNKDYSKGFHPEGTLVSFILKLSRAGNSVLEANRVKLIHL